VVRSSSVYNLYQRSSKCNVKGTAVFADGISIVFVFKHTNELQKDVYILYNIWAEVSGVIKTYTLKTLTKKYKKYSIVFYCFQ